MKFGINDIYRRHDEDHPLTKMLYRTVTACFVEFLNPNRDTTMARGAKPHVVFNLKVDLDVEAGQDMRPYLGCRLSVEQQTDWGDRFELKLLKHADSSRASTLAFEFPVYYRMCVFDWIEILRGKHEGIPQSGAYCYNQPCPGGYIGDLTDFQFTEVQMSPTLIKFDGCRDFIAQCMVRLCAIGLVGWQIIALKRDGSTAEALQYINSRGYTQFHDIIPYNFRFVILQNGEESFSPVRLPLHPGTFWDADVTRHTVYTTVDNDNAYISYTLPYHPLPATAGNFGGGGGGGGGDGGNYGGGGHPGQPQLPYPDRGYSGYAGGAGPSQQSYGGPGYGQYGQDPYGGAGPSHTGYSQQQQQAHKGSRARDVRPSKESKSSKKKGYSNQGNAGYPSADHYQALYQAQYQAQYEAQLQAEYEAQQQAEYEAQYHAQQQAQYEAQYKAQYPGQQTYRSQQSAYNRAIAEAATKPGKKVRGFGKIRLALA